MEAVFTGTPAERTGRRRAERGQTMKYGQFIATVRDNGDYSGREEAERVTEAVLSVLRDRLTEEGADHLAAQLPEPLDELMRDRDSARAESYGSAEFCRRVAGMTGATERTAEWDADAVLSTLAGTVSGGELNHLLSQLPSGYAPFFGKNELAD
jgi:uncharacterized protein (DUF2267 family)